MLYLNEQDIATLGTDWGELIGVLEQTVFCLRDGDYSQPVKPYLRYGNPKNRIIAMPAYVGGGFNTAGMKWIASYPDNINYHIPRAHSVIIINDSLTGEPKAVINTALLSMIRTAAVSGLMLAYYRKVRPLRRFNLGIVGWGPIGRHHFKMCTDLYGECIDQIYLFDLKKIEPDSIDPKFCEKVTVVNAWKDAYVHSDVFITCTVSESRYVDVPPKPGNLLLNVSLRDFTADALNAVKTIIVDDWEEVCRENTDIEMLHQIKGLTRQDTLSIIDVVCRGGLGEPGAQQSVLFCPMGMAVFDISTASYYMQQALSRGVGLQMQ